MKPGRFGIKAFTLAESSNGYLLNSKIYIGKEGNVVERDLGKKAVLCVMEPFLDKGYYVLWTIIIHWWHYLRNLRKGKVWHVGQ